MNSILIIIFIAFPLVTIFTLAMCRSAGMADRHLEHSLATSQKYNSDFSIKSTGESPVDNRHETPTVPLRRIGISM